MKRVGNSRAISDLEFVLEAPSIGDTRRAWTSHGAACVRDRHRFSGPSYEFTIEVVHVQLVKSGRTSWHVMIVTEWWRDAETDIRSTKWLKVLRGKPSDISGWVRRCREQKVEKSTAAQPVQVVGRR
jgi:hypothetical protein